MSVNDKAYDDEIDLLEWFQTIWEGKWKILSIMAISVMATINIAVMIILKIINIIYLFPTQPHSVSISPLRVFTICINDVINFNSSITVIDSLLFIIKSYYLMFNWFN